MLLSLVLSQSRGNQNPQYITVAYVVSDSSCISVHGLRRIHSERSILLPDRVLVHKSVPAHWYWAVPGSESAASDCQQSAS